MDTQSLQTFITLAEYRNFTKTTDALFIAQSTVTNRIAELEKEIGKQLFDRNKRKVILSKEGVFLFYAKRILEMQSVGILMIWSSSRVMRMQHMNTVLRKKS